MCCTETGQRIALFTHARRTPTSMTFKTGTLALVLILFTCTLTCSQDTDTSGTPVSWSAPLQVATGNGVRGPWRMNRSNFQYVDDPNAHVTGVGHIAMTWVDQSRQDIFLQRYDQDGNPRLDTPVNVSKTPDVFSWFPDVVMTENQPSHVYVLWQEIVFSGGSHGGEAFFARSTDGCRTFEEPLNLSRSQEGDGKGRLTEDHWDNGSLDLAIGPDGTLFAAWTEYEGRLWFRYSTDDGQSFSDPLLVAGKSGQPPARGPSLAVPSGKEVYITWTVGERQTADVRFRTIHYERQTMSDPRIVHRTKGRSDAPKIAVDRTGRIHLVHGEHPVNPNDTDQVRYTRSTDGGQTFQPPEVLSNTRKAPHDSAGFPGLATTGKRTVVVTWEGLNDRRFRGLPNRLMYAVSQDGGGTFSSPEQVPGTVAPEGGFNGSQQGQLMGKLHVNPHGDIVVVNSSFVPDRRSSVQLIRGALTD